METRAPAIFWAICRAGFPAPAAKSLSPEAKWRERETCLNLYLPLPTRCSLLQELRFADHVGWSPYNLRLAFQELVRRCELRPGDPLYFVGCPGACYSQATLFSTYLRQFDLRIFFVPDADPSRARRLVYNEDLGFVGGPRAKPPKAKVIVVMSGLCKSPIEPLLQLVSGTLEEGGKLVAETNNPGIYDSLGWDRRIPFDYQIEFAVERVKLYSR